MGSECLLCPFVSGDFRGEPICSVGRKGALTLVNASRKRSDNLHVLFEQVLEGLQHDATKKLDLHSKCRQYYVEPNRIRTGRKRQGASV